MNCYPPELFILAPAVLFSLDKQAYGVQLADFRILLQKNLEYSRAKEFKQRSQVQNEEDTPFL